MDIAYPSLDRTDLTEQTYKVLRDRILRRQLKPGEKVSVAEVAGGLGVSRTPVITALQKLAGEGLVEIVPRRGTFVTELTARDVTEFFDIRTMIELYAAEFILKAGKTGQLFEDVKEAMVGMEHATNDDDYGDYEAFMASDRDLHLALVKLTENEHLLQIYSNLNVHIQVARTHYLNSVEKARQAQREHEAIMKAFGDGKADEVREALCTHIGYVKARILEILDERGGKL
jgi:DNA-binding GntR family transcriptional regulator